MDVGFFFHLHLSPPRSLIFRTLCIFPLLLQSFSAGSLPAELPSFHSGQCSIPWLTDTIFSTSFSVHLTPCLCKSCTKQVREFFFLSSRWQPCTVSEGVYLSRKLRTSLPDKIEVTGILGGDLLFLTQFSGFMNGFSLSCQARALATEEALKL